MQDFGPESNSWDRRILYEVTGLRLKDAEFRGDETSSSEDDYNTTINEPSRKSTLRASKSKKRKVIDIDRLDRIMDSLLLDDTND